MVWHEEHLPHKSEGPKTLSPGLPYLLANTMSDSLQLWKLHIWSSWKGRDIHSSIFPHNQSFTKEEKESADAGELSSWISGRVFFFFLYPPVDSLSDSYKTHPSLVSVFHWIGWRYLLHSLTLRNKLRRVSSSSQISRAKHSNLGNSLFFSTQSRNKWKISPKKGRCKNCMCLSLKTPTQSSPASKILVLRNRARLRGWLVYFLSAIFISLFTCCSVSIYPWWGLLLGRNDHFQQQSPRITATCHIVPVTTNDYQCIWASCQRAGLGTAVGGWGLDRRWWRWGLCAPRRQRFSSHVAALKPHITSPQSTKSQTYRVPRDWINLLWEADWYGMSGGQESERVRGSRDMGVIWFIQQSGPLFLSNLCSLVLPRSEGSLKLYFACIFFGTKIQSKTHYPHK